jgi:hypothetical protein
MKFSTPVIRTVIVSILALLLASPSDAFNDVTIDGSFADWTDEFCRPDDTCDDFPDQADAKGACIASNFVTPGPATTAHLRFDFDVTGLSGANTADGCWLVDVDQNGNVDRALCFSLQGNPLVLQTTQMFTCNDNAAETCGGPTAAASSADCDENTNLTTDRLLNTCSGDSADTGVECSVPLTDLGWVSGRISLLKACTYNSAQPNSNTSDCMADGTNPFIIDPENGENVPVELQEFSVE